MNRALLPRPFLKWAGGKTQLSDELLKRCPENFGNYFEPFVGSGAIFFRLHREKKIKRAVLSDINAELIDTYLAIRDQVSEVISILENFSYSESFYYHLRSRNPLSLSLSERAARMIYLNKTGYNGLYRVNRNGQFNVPFGRYKSPKYLDKENLTATSQALQNVEIICAPFNTIIDRVEQGDWVYFDPPYVPVSQTANFTAYYASGFGLREQEQLRDVCLKLTGRGVYVTISNSNTPAVYTLYLSSVFKIDEVLANRAINCDHSKRGKVKEVIITNYSVNRIYRSKVQEQQILLPTFQKASPMSISF